jgi:hypothetical protein
MWRLITREFNFRSTSGCNPAGECDTVAPYETNRTVRSHMFAIEGPTAMPCRICRIIYWVFCKKEVHRPGLPHPKMCFCAVSRVKRQVEHLRAA